MAIVKAYTLPHPPLAIPAVGRGQENEIAKTLAAIDEVASEIAEIAPETIIYITPHSVLYSDHFHISPGDSGHGDLGRFGASHIKFDVEYDKELIEEISRLAVSNGISAGTLGERDASMDHGVTVPMWFINRHYTNYRAIRVSQSGMTPIEHYLFGQIMAEAVNSTGRRTVVIASSDLSHKLQADGPYGFSSEGPEFDALFTAALDKGDFLSIFNIPSSLREEAAECGYNSVTILAGCFDKIDVDAKLLSYEGPFGVGYAVASFAPAGRNEDKNTLEKYMEQVLTDLNEKRNAEDEYQNLARQSLEHIIRTGEMLPVPNGLQADLMQKQAGVFVSIHKNGILRGCIGTTAPTTACVAEEIIQNAISAGLSDSRFNMVAAEELPFLVYKVDVLLKPEKISGPHELDVKKYGVIVKSGIRRGLLLPNLDGVDTVEDQINIACKKAGISDSDSLELERFEVIRHE